MARRKRMSSLRTGFRSNKISELLGNSKRRSFTSGEISALALGQDLTAANKFRRASLRSGLSSGEISEYYSQRGRGYTHAFVDEDRERISNRNLSWVGTTRTAGSGGTYATLIAAYNASANGDTIQLVSNIDTSSEPGGYALFNTAGKGVLIDLNGFTITQSAAALYSLRFRDCGTFELKNGTLSHGQVNATMYIEGDYASRVFVFNNITFRNTGNNDAGYFVRIVNLALTDSTDKWFEFKDCNFLKTFASTTNANLVTTGPASNTTQFLFTGCSFDMTNSSGLKFIDNTKPKLAVYDCSFTQRSSDTILYFGTDGAIPVTTGMDIDLRGNTLQYATGFGQHSILFGNGTDLVYAVNNILSADASSDTGVIGFVIKTVATVVGNAVFDGNYVNHPRPLLVKGGSKLTIRYNSFVANYTNNYGLYVDNVVISATDFLCRDIVCTNNNFVGVDGGMIVLSVAPTAEKVKTSMLTWALNNNRYYASNELYVSDSDNGAVVQWPDKSSYWALDANSTLLNSGNIALPD